MTRAETGNYYIFCWPNITVVNDAKIVVAHYTTMFLH